MRFGLGTGEEEESGDMGGGVLGEGNSREMRFEGATDKPAFCSCLTRSAIPPPGLREEEGMGASSSGVLEGYE